MIDIQPQLQVTPAGASVRIEARVRSDAGARTPWRLVVEVAGPGGRSDVRQSGVSDGTGAVVTRTTVNADAAGRAVLQADAPDGTTREAVVELGPAPAR